MPEPLTLEQNAALVSAYAELEQRLYEVLGTWAGAEPVAGAAVLFDELSQQHAWHAELWAERVPAVPGLAVVSGGCGPGHDLLRAAAGLDGGAPRLAALSRIVLPRVVAGYRFHIARATEVTDGPVIRALRLALHDDVDAMLRAEDLLQSLAGAAEAAEAVAGVLGGPERALPGPGLVAWPA